MTSPKQILEKLSSLDNTDANPTPAVLSQREKEIFDLLLDGKAPKTIGYDLDVSYGTVKFHQNNLYKKLDIQSIQELFAQYKPGFTPPPKPKLTKKRLIAAGVAIIAIAVTVLLLYERNKNFIPILDPWYAISDPNSTSRIYRADETIEGKRETCVTISGTLYNDEFFPRINGCYAGKGMPYVGAFGRVYNKSLAAIRTMRSLSFKVMGDGNRYYVRLPTFETIETDHWLYIFPTVKDEITSVHITIPDDLFRLGWSGKDAPFLQGNVMFIEFQPVDPGDFNIK
ncbi:MAG: helix-turn-helix transcriptional regulator, partial [Treponema sp.]|nr:helix-turn-helix transcriptional regulator [Treponema sp.]